MTDVGPELAREQLWLQERLLPNGAGAGTSAVPPTGAVRYNPFKSIQSGRNSILLPYKNQPIVDDGC